MKAGDVISTLLSLSVVAALPRLRRQTDYNRPHNEHIIREEDIIELPVGRFPDPICNHTILWGGAGPNGRPVASSPVTLGDSIYHRWQCVYPERNVDLYCIMVHDCVVRQGSAAVPIIDEFGCSYYPDVIPHISYSEDLIGGIQIQAFGLSFDSREKVTFNCGIKLLLKRADSGSGGKFCARPRCAGYPEPQEYPRRG